MSSQSSNHLMRTFGAMLLIAGCCMGAGMLGLPLVTARAGFLPTVVTFLISWAFMVVTGLLLLEVNLWFGTGINLMTLAEKILGKKAKLAVGLLFVFLFYCLNVAYLAGGSALITEFIEQAFGVFVEPYVGSMALVLVFGIVIFFGTYPVDLVNRLLMAGLVVSYGALMTLGMQHVQIDNFKEQAWSYVIPALPAMIISFGYHNLIPSLTDYLQGNARHLRIAIFGGTLIPLVLYLLWDGMILGILTPGASMQESIDSGAMVTTLLRQSVGASIVVDLMQAFAFFAIVTSFLTIDLSFVDFLADGLKMQKTSRGKLLLLALVLLPPLVFAYLYPYIFLTALNYAGAFGAVILFGVIPVMMVWKGRYQEMQKGIVLVPGGKVTLVIIGAFAVFITLMQLLNELGVTG